MTQFQAGKTYTTRSVCDSACIFAIEVISRTEKTITFKYHGTVKRCKIKMFDGVESAFALGTYSMAPIFRAA